MPLILYVEKIYSVFRTNKHLNMRRHSMKNSLIQTIAAAALTLGSLSAAHAADLDKAQIEATLEGYERVLNASDVDGILELYTEDGVFMAPNIPSAV